MFTRFRVGLLATFLGLCLVFVVSVIPVSAAQDASVITAIRAAHHAEVTPHYDRVVFELSSLPSGITVEYVPQLIGDGSGRIIPIQGGAILQVRFSPASAHNQQFQPTVPARISFGLPMVKEVVQSGDFESVVTYGIGISKKSEWRFLTLSNPTRVAIDFFN